MASTVHVKRSLHFSARAVKRILWYLIRVDYDDIIHTCDCFPTKDAVPWYSTEERLMKKSAPSLTLNLKFSSVRLARSEVTRNAYGPDTMIVLD